MALTVFKLPKRLINVEAHSVLDGWHRGFSSHAAVDHLEAIGASLPSKPEDPDLPADITVVTSEELGRLYGQFVGYTGWLETELSLAEMAADEEQAFLEHKEAEIRLRKAGTVSDKTAKTKNDEFYIQAEQAALMAQAKAKLLKVRVRSYERCCGALSREMTRRLGDIERVQHT
jgi:hypothetical protein